MGGIAEENFSGTVSDAVSLASVTQALVDAVRWIFADEIDRPRAGVGVDALAASR